MYSLVGARSTGMSGFLFCFLFFVLIFLFYPCSIQVSGCMNWVVTGLCSNCGFGSNKTTLHLLTDDTE